MRQLLTILLALQAAAAPPSSLEVLEVRRSFYVIAGTGGPGGDVANIGVQVGEDGVVVVDAGCLLLPASSLSRFNASKAEACQRPRLDSDRVIAVDAMACDSLGRCA